MYRVTQDQFPEHLAARLKMTLSLHSFSSSPPFPNPQTSSSSLHCPHSPLMKRRVLPQGRPPTVLLPLTRGSFFSVCPQASVTEIHPPSSGKQRCYLPDCSFTTQPPLLCIVLVFACFSVPHLVARQEST